MEVNQNFSGTLFLAWLLIDLIATYSVIHYLRGLVPLLPAWEAPPAAILIAIKGVSENTAPFLAALCGQKYPKFRLIFSLESAADPAFAVVEKLRRKFAGRIGIELVVAGRATERAQKVHNHLAALKVLHADDALVVFADADIAPHSDWLAQLLRPIVLGEVAASTGYRWILPADRHLPSLIASAVDNGIATSARSFRWNLCWGGSTAVARAALDAIDLPTVWARAATDDLTLTAALRAGNYKINAPLRVLVPSPVKHTWGSLFSFARRQYLFVRTYTPRHWLLCGATLCLPTLAAAVAVAGALAGSPWAPQMIIASFVLLQVRVQARRRIADQVLPAGAIDPARASLVFACWAWPLIHLVHLAAFLASVIGRRYTWAGIDYRLDGGATVVEGRAGDA
jgi:ceramide glucosyltransferase